MCGSHRRTGCGLSGYMCWRRGYAAHWQTNGWTTSSIANCRITSLCWSRRTSAAACRPKKLRALPASRSVDSRRSERLTGASADCHRSRCSSRISAMASALSDRMPPEEATRAARIALGGLTQIRETHRGQRGLPQIEMLLQDLRYGLRTFGRNPVFTIVAVLTLALAIGVNTTLFTAFDAVALKPLPVKDAGSVVRAIRWFESGSHGAGQYLFSYPEYLFYRRQNQVFSSLIAASLPIRVTASSGEPFLTGQLVSDNYFSDLGAGAILGRTFATEEHRTPGAHPVIVLSYPRSEEHTSELQS